MASLYLDLVVDVPEEYKKLLYMLFSRKDKYALKKWLKTLTPEEKHITTVIKDLILLIENDYISNTKLAKEMLENAGISFKK